MSMTPRGSRSAVGVSPPPQPAALEASNARAKPSRGRVTDLNSLTSDVNLQPDRAKLLPLGISNPGYRLPFRFRQHRCDETNPHWQVIVWPGCADVLSMAQRGGSCVRR